MAPILVVATEVQIVFSHVARVYSKDHVVLSMADSSIECSTSGRVVHTHYIARYDELRVKTVLLHGLVVVLLRWHLVH